MTKELGVAIERWALGLSHAQRKEVYDALDWYHTDGLYATKRDDGVAFMDLPEGRWPTVEMSIEAAREKFDRLEAIGWLRLNED